MTLNTKPRMDVVKREDKETKLKTFIADYLTTSSPACVSQPWLLVARSPESPVVQALLALAPAIHAAGVTVRTLFTQVAVNAPDSAALPPLGYTSEMRVLHDLRLLDAHEQLCLDSRNSWVGDCMRREPAKRDAYECYASGYAQTADWSSKAFERLWAKGEPVIVAQAEPAAGPNPASDMDACVPAANQVPATMVALTRH
jgi:hypothetical protein